MRKPEYSKAILSLILGGTVALAGTACSEDGPAGDGNAVDNTPGAGGGMPGGIGGTGTSGGSGPGGGAGADPVPSAGAGAGAGGSAGGEEVPPGAPLQSILVGRFAILASHGGTLPVFGAAQLVRPEGGGTMVQVAAGGLVADKEYPAHVHAGPCSSDGLGHYKIDPSVEATEEANELWPKFTTNADGFGTASISNDHVARGDALSIVIHDPDMDGAKMACADLLPSDGDSVAATGEFAPFAAAEAGDMTIAGTASLVRGAGKTTVEVKVSGLDAAETYRSHVHALPCGVNEAGGHYKVDPAEAMVVEANELWPTVGMPPAGGMVEDSFTSEHLAREDAQSIVIHRAVEMTAPKVACADLIRADYQNAVTQGEALLLETGMANTPNMTATAVMTRNLDSTTEVTLSVTGGPAGAMLPVHVHDAACSTGGGGHYKQDLTVAEVVEANEIWLPVAIDESGAGTSNAKVGYTARAEAMALVIHDEEGARLACIDLN